MDTYSIIEIFTHNDGTFAVLGCEGDYFVMAYNDDVDEPVTFAYTDLGAQQFLTVAEAKQAILEATS